MYGISPKSLVSNYVVIHKTYVNKSNSRNHKETPEPITKELTARTTDASRAYEGEVESGLCFI